MGEVNNKAWEGVIKFPLAGRLNKPRIKGLTMVIDKGMGIAETWDLLQISSDYIDYLKLGFGTSAFYNESILRKKISLAKEHGVDVYPGGTFLEVAVYQQRLPQYLERARELGFSTVEISDGALPMTAKVRASAIDLALRKEFRVITEVGKKDPRDKTSPGELIDQITADIACGAYKVIVEGRETGKGIGFFDSSGVIIKDELEELLSSISDLDRLIFETPLKNQQTELIQQLGPNVNLGNIQPGDVLALEALRVGLRADTFKTSILESEKVVPLFQRGNPPAGTGS